jgi:hypothetical protein
MARAHTRLIGATPVTTADGIRVTGKLPAVSQPYAGIHALADVDSGSQTRTLDVANGIVQTLSADQDFTLAVTGPAGEIVLAHLYVWNTDGVNAIEMARGSGHTASSSPNIPQGETYLFQFLWDGTRGWRLNNGTGSGTTGDKRPS